MNGLYVSTKFIASRGEMLHTGDEVTNDRGRLGIIVFRYGRYQVQYDNYYVDLIDEHSTLTLCS